VDFGADFGTDFGTDFATGFVATGFDTGFGAGFDERTAALANFATGLLFLAGLRALGAAVLVAAFFAFAEVAAFTALTTGFFFTAVARDIAQAP